MDPKKSEDYSKNYSFRPDVSKSVAVLKGDRATERPIHERLGQIQKQKQEYLHRLRIEAELNNPDLTFQPKITGKSAAMAESRIEIPDVTERLLRDAADKPYKRALQAEQYHNVISATCTFKPSINPTSGEDILENNDVYKYQKDMVARQYLMSDIQKEKIERKVAKMIEEEKCTFNPSINKISNFLVEADAERANETPEQRMERLSKKDAVKREIFQEQMQKAYYDQFSFQPEINEISKGIGKKTSLDCLAYNKEGKQHIKMMQEQSVYAELEGCSFRPVINKNKGEKAVPYYKDKENIMDNIKIMLKKKEIEIDQQKKISEYQELKECTFKPEVKREVPEEHFKEKSNSDND